MIQRDTERMAYDDRGRNWRYVATSQGMPRIASNTRDLKKVMEQILPNGYQRECVSLMP